MAKWTFEDYANGAMAVVGLCMFAHGMYQMHKEAADAQDRHAADRYVREAQARVRNMADHALKNRITKEGYAEMISAAKNRISYDAQDVLGDNGYRANAVTRIHQYLDTIAKI